MSRIWELVKPFWHWIALGLLIVLGCSVYQYHKTRASRFENQSQLLKVELEAKKDEAKKAKADAQAADLKALEMAKAAEEASKKAAAEHAKSEALKAKYDHIRPLEPLPGTPSDDPSVLKDQYIAQIEIKTQSQQVEIGVLKQQVRQLTISRDAWRLTAEKQEEALKLADQRMRAQEIAQSALKAQGTLREAKGIGEGAAVAVVAHLLGLF